MGQTSRDGVTWLLALLNCSVNSHDYLPAGDWVCKYPIMEVGRAHVSLLFQVYRQLMIERGGRGMFSGS